MHRAPGHLIPLGNLSKPLIAPPPPVTKPVTIRPADGTQLMVGIDVGSTTVKAVVIDPANDQILWRDYQRHDTKQPEKVLEFWTASKRKSASPRETPAFSSPARRWRHGASARREIRAGSQCRRSGGGKLYPQCGSVIELGGQDAKIIIFKKMPRPGAKENPFDER